MLDIIIDTIIDGLKVLPFLFVAFLIIEVVEHKFSDKSNKVLKHSGFFGPLFGAVLGCFPQCGFSVMATNLYVTRIISLGTLISIYLSTSDEMLPILLSNGCSFYEIIKLIGIKVLIGIVSGFLIDLIYRKNDRLGTWDLCDDEDCHCEKGIFISSLKHTLHIGVFLLVVNFILNTVMFYGGSEFLSKVLGANTIIAPFISCLIGLIPNCASSVVITELYLSGVLSLSSTISGLLTGSGVALLVLFKNNKNMKENVKILLLVYFIGVISGLLLELLECFL